jgi:hypothetical protein
MNDKNRMIAVLEEFGENDGLKASHGSSQLFDAFDCQDYPEFFAKLWAVYRILREGRLKKDVTAAMIMLDCSEYTDEQPTQDPQRRLKEVALMALHQPHDFGLFRAHLSWKRGIRHLVDHFEAVVNELDRAKLR